MADVVEVNCTTGEVTERAFTPEEIAANQQAATAYAAQQAADAAAAQAAATALAATNAKLIALGLTQDDINNLLNAAKNPPLPTTGA
jgi:ribosomal protein S11